MVKVIKITGYTLSGCIIAVVAFISWAWVNTYAPGGDEKAQVQCDKKAKLLKKGQKVKVLNWNVQYMAGKSYVFFYDAEPGVGKDTSPSQEHITQTIRQVADFIKNEDPDILLIQELHDGSKRTHYRDQLAELRQQLGDYPCYASAYYWKSAFILHPAVMGPENMKLTTLSKFHMEQGYRYQMPLQDNDFLTEHFYFHRAVLETRLPVAKGKPLVVMNTHLDAFAMNSDTMTRQVNRVNQLLASHEKAMRPWLIGGDFNLLPPGKSRSRLKAELQPRFNKTSELKLLYDNYSAIPSFNQVESENYSRYFTHFPNDPRVKAPDRTIDYIFYGRQLKLLRSEVRQKGTLNISDHLPMLATFQLR